MWNGKIFKLWGSIAVQDEYLGFWSFPIFFRVLHQTGNNLFTLNQAFIKKNLEKPSSKTFLVDTRSKTSFLTSATVVDTQQMSKTQNRLVIKPKIIESLSASQNHSVNLLYYVSLTNIRQGVQIQVINNHKIKNYLSTTKQSNDYIRESRGFLNSLSALNFFSSKQNRENPGLQAVHT